MVKSDLESKDLVELLLRWLVNHWEEGSGEIFAIYKAAQYPKPHVRAFLDFLIKKLEKV